MATELAAALAFELGNHIDDLTDDAELAKLESEDGEQVGELVDTSIRDATSFWVHMKDGRKLRVTVEEMQ